MSWTGVKFCLTLNVPWVTRYLTLWTLWAWQEVLGRDDVPPPARSWASSRMHLNQHGCAHTLAFLRVPVQVRLATDSQLTDSWLREGMGACCSISEPSITHTQRDEANTGNRRPYPSATTWKKAIKVLAPAPGLFPWPNFWTQLCLVLVWLDLLLLCHDPSQRSSVCLSKCVFYTVCSTMTVICYPN